MSERSSQSKMRSGDEIRREFRNRLRRKRYAEDKRIKLALQSIPNPLNGCQILQMKGKVPRGVVTLVAWRGDKLATPHQFSIDRSVFTEDINPETFYADYKESLEWLTEEEG